MYISHKIQHGSSVLKLPYQGEVFLEKMLILNRLLLGFSANISVSWIQ